MKQQGFTWPKDNFKPIHMPKGTATGVLISALSLGFGFAMVWYIWWLAIITFIGMIGLGIAHTFNYKRDYYIPVDEVAATEAKGAAV